MDFRTYRNATDLESPGRNTKKNRRTESQKPPAIAPVFRVYRSVLHRENVLLKPDYKQIFSPARMEVESFPICSEER